MYQLFYQHITLQRVENSGAFLSFGDSLTSTEKNIFLNILPFLILLLGLVFIFRKKSLDMGNLLGITLIIGGGFGNLYDRVLYGSVTDFMHIKFGMLQTGIFNVADMCIMTGMFIILIKSFFKTRAVVEEGVPVPENGV
jgi:signal peptidase II